MILSFTLDNKTTKFNIYNKQLIERISMHPTVERYLNKQMTREEEKKI